MNVRHEKSGERGRQPEEWLAATLVELADTLIDEAFARLRGYSRHHNRGLTSVATAFLSGNLTADDLKAPSSAGTARSRAPKTRTSEPRFARPPD